MKNPILVPEFREYLSHNNIKARLGACVAESSVIAVKPLPAPTVSVIPIHPPIPNESSFTPSRGGLRYD